MSITTRLRRFFFPCIGIDAPLLESHFTISDEWSVAKRLWHTTTFDLATLGSKHRLHLSWHLMDAFLGGVNCEVAIDNVDDHQVARERARLLQAMLYLEGVPPFLMPFVATHSINEYSGINSRDSNVGIQDLPEGLREGITSATSTVEVWPNDLSLNCITVSSGRVITVEVVRAAINRAADWAKLEATQRQVKVARLALLTAPTIPDIGSSLLHIRQGIESLFPDVQMEVSFRISLLMAQLASGHASAKDTYNLARQSYKQRSNAAHGNFGRIGIEEWRQAWRLLNLCLKSVASRRKLPNEGDLILELLDGQREHT